MEEQSTWARLRWPIKAIIIAVPIIGAGYWAMQSGKFDAAQGNTFGTDTTATVQQGTPPTISNNDKKNI